MRVKDNGSGIPESARHKVFEPSFTTKSSGMGLGLAMVKNLVESFGGTIWFETSRNGTEFIIELPLTAAKSN
jgi:signal transduction histidine kinase